MNCPFCDIRDGIIPSQPVFEDDEILAFNDLAPQAPIHILIIPRRHIRSIDTLSEEEMPLVGRMIQVAALLARERGVASDGYRLVINCNRKGGQSVFHLHLHLLAGRWMNWPPG